MSKRRDYTNLHWQGYLGVFILVAFLLFTFPKIIAWVFGIGDYSLSLLTSLLIALPVTILFVLSTKKQRGTNHLVILEKDGYTDLGPGPIYMGLYSFFFRRILDYDPKERHIDQSISLPTRDGKVMKANLKLTWRPDPENLGHFFDSNQTKRVDVVSLSSLQAWSKQLLPGEVYFADPPKIEDIPGVLADRPVLTDITPEDGTMDRYIWDSTHLLQSIVNEIEDENRIETKRLELKRDYPDRGDRIDRLIEQRKAELRRRGLRENR